MRWDKAESEANHEFSLQASEREEKKEQIDNSLPRRSDPEPCALEVVL